MKSGERKGEKREGVKSNMNRVRDRNKLREKVSGEGKVRGGKEISKHSDRNRCEEGERGG